MTMVLASMVMIMLCTATVGLAVGDIVDSHRSAANEEARAVAAAGLDEFFSRVVANPNVYFDTTQPTNYTTHPAYAPNWAAFDTQGRPIACPDFNTTCYQLVVHYRSSPESAVVQSTARTYCRGDTTGSGCVYARSEQTLRRRQFFDYLYFSNREALDPLITPSSPLGPGSSFEQTNCTGLFPRPSGCLDVAYQARQVGSDLVDGPVHTNDSAVLVCGNPHFKDTVEATGYSGSSGTTAWTTPNTTGCTGANSNPVFDKAPTVVSAISIPQSRTSLGTAAAVAGTKWSYVGTVTITANGSTLSVSCSGSSCPTTGSTLAYPDGRVIFVDGTAVVSGTVVGGLSIVSQCSTGTPGVGGCGDIQIPADLTVNSLAANSPDIVGLNALGSVVITNYNGAADRTVDAAMLAVSHSVYVAGWQTGLFTSPVPTLHVTGALDGAWRGAYGGYNPDGNLASGYTKDFHFDRRLQRIQPPYFLQPVAASWARVDEVEVPPCPNGASICTGVS